MASSHPVSRHAAVLLAAALLAFGASAASIGNLYEVEVAAASRGDGEAFRQAMADVLTRVTGRRDAGALPALAPLLADPQRYVTSYHRSGAGRLTVSFNGNAIEQALATAGLPYWGENRPTTLVWLAVDRGGQRGLVTSQASSSERLAVEAVAGQRGLPLAWPEAGGGENVAQRFEQIWAGDTAALAASASRYGADGVLIGRATAVPGSRHAVQWTFIGAGGTARASGELADGVHLAADRYAGVLATTAGAQRRQFEVTVAGVTTARQYVGLLRYLEGLSVVRGVTVSTVGADSVAFQVAIRGEPAALRREAIAGGRLRPLEGGAGPLVFSYQP